jgi:hypothetical protein
MGSEITVPLLTLRSREVHIAKLEITNLTGSQPEFELGDDECTSTDVSNLCYVVSEATQWNPRKVPFRRRVELDCCQGKCERVESGGVRECWVVLPVLVDSMKTVEFRQNGARLVVMRLSSVRNEPVDVCCGRTGRVPSHLGHVLCPLRDGTSVASPCTGCRVTLVEYFDGENIKRVNTRRVVVQHLER